MEARAGTVMALAADYYRIGYAVLTDGELYDWGLSEKAAGSQREAADKAKRWIELYRPDLILTEMLTPQCRKGAHARSLIEALAEMAEQSGALHQAVLRVQDYANKYAEIDAICLRFPQIKLWAPEPRKFFEKEPRETIYFEAISLALAFDPSGLA